MSAIYRRIPRRAPGGGRGGPWLSGFGVPAINCSHRESGPPNSKRILPKSVYRGILSLNFLGVGFIHFVFRGQPFSRPRILRGDAAASEVTRASFMGKVIFCKRPLYCNRQLNLRSDIKKTLIFRALMDFPLGARLWEVLFFHKVNRTSDCCANAAKVFNQLRKFLIYVYLRPRSGRPAHLKVGKSIAYGT